MLILESLIFVGVPLVIGNHFVQISQIIYKNADLLWPLQEVLQSELQVIFRLEQIYHLAYRVFIVELGGSILHITQTLVLLLEIMLQLVPGHDAVII